MSLKETRIKLGKTQAEMARMIGVSERTWIRYEQKTPRPIRLLVSLLATHSGHEHSSSQPALV